ncbi:hypothetical protein [Microcystis aeruginosa]|uniref:hypothetical protein n=1 Tax=Microcystis aeruginosa TaxID=1126 RepID=UPI001E5C29BF|nr:hypothetical protein [Microcystis aeruginosa]
MPAERNGRKIVVEIKSFLILNPLSNAQKTGFSEKPVFYSEKPVFYSEKPVFYSEKPVFYSCTHAKRGINNQSLITRFSISP